MVNIVSFLIPDASRLYTQTMGINFVRREIGMSSAQPRAGRIFGTFMIRSWRVISHPRVLIKPVANKGAGPTITLSDYAARGRVVGRRCPRELQLHTIRPRATQQSKKLEKCSAVGCCARRRSALAIPSWRQAIDAAEVVDNLAALKSTLRRDLLIWPFCYCPSHCPHPVSEKCRLAFN